MHATMTRTVEYSVQPWIPWATDIDDTADAVLDALEADDRALGPVLGADLERGRLEALFQVEVADTPDARGEAVTLAGRIFDAALRTAGLAFHTAGISIAGTPEEL